MSTHDTDREQYARLYETAVKQAQGGDKRIAELLISAFAELAHDPHVFDAVGGIPSSLIRHIASCLSDWKSRDFPDAETWFYVTRPAHRPDDTSFKHAMAMRTYMLLMARAKGVDVATAGAAAYSGLSEEQVRHLVAKDKPAKAPYFLGPSIGVLGCAALLNINKWLHSRVLNPPRKKYQRRP